MLKKEKESFNINNRKYLGAKTKLLNFIDETFEKFTKNKYDSIIDLFAGTGVVSDYFISKGKKVIVNDFLDSNFIIYNAFFGNNKSVRPEILSEITKKFNGVDSKKINYFSTFGNKYFTINDANKIGSIREEIEILFRNKNINSSERNILIASLVYSADRAANSMGHYEIYIEREISDKFVFKLINWKNKNHAEKILNTDANFAIRNLKADILYLDPPYNSRQYSTLYHLLDTLANWDNPTLTGKGLKPEINKQSKFSLKDAREAMLDLVLHADVKYIFISYNNTNTAKNSRTAAKISDDEMMQILSLRGKVTKVEKDFKPYNTGNSKLRDYKEIIYVCEVTKPILSETIVKYPFNYMGGKYKLIDKIKENFNKIEENKRHFFIDVFSGGSTVGANSNFKKVFSFDSNLEMINILNKMKTTKTFESLDKLDSIIEKYDLSNSRKLGYDFYDGKGNSGLNKFNKEKYNKLRIDYNKNPDIFKLMVLVIFSFNNSMNFNLSGEFNIPCGKRDFNKEMRKNYILFSEKLKNIDISFIHSDFRHIEKLLSNKKNVSYYFDPPYIAGFAHYNKSWTETEESDLLNMILRINENSNWVLSNSLKIGNNDNKLLQNFITENKFKKILVNHNYDNSWFHKKEKGNEEIILTNIK